jgi:YHS domain-containing protein
MHGKKKKYGVVFLLAGLLLVGLITLTGGTEKSEPAAPAEASVVKATVEGVNFCLGCALKKQKGAGAQCSIFGHRHTLKLNKAVSEDGQELTKMRGWVLHYLETEKSRELIKTHHGQTLTIKGKVYPQERVLEVDFFKEHEAVPREIEKVTSAIIEQTTCPVMGGAINKDIFTEYKGTKVYFCCPGCVDRFKADPEKYLAKLPQFKD